MSAMTPFQLLENVRTRKPLVHHITNWVTICDCANIVKVFGASPVMAHAPEEAADMAGLASALVLNIGTLTVELVEAMKIAARSANRKGIPVVLDACGAGATRMRDEKCGELLDTVRIDIIKGNISEIARLAGEKAVTKGVDAAGAEQDAVDIARLLARRRRCTVAITGAEDVVAGEAAVYRVANGHRLMADIVGTGCMAASVIGAFAAVEKDYTYAAAAGLCCFEIAAERAAESAGGPGSFKERLFDEAYRLDEETVRSRARIRGCAK